MGDGRGAYAKPVAGPDTLREPQPTVKSTCRGALAPLQNLESVKEQPLQCLTVTLYAEEGCRNEKTPNVSNRKIKCYRATLEEIIDKNLLNWYYMRFS
jgi:hypothetical protein